MRARRVVSRTCRAEARSEERPAPGSSPPLAAEALQAATGNAALQVAANDAGLSSQIVHSTIAVSAWNALRPRRDRLMNSTSGRLRSRNGSTPAAGGPSPTRRKGAPSEVGSCFGCEPVSRCLLARRRPRARTSSAEAPRRRQGASGRMKARTPADPRPTSAWRQPVLLARMLPSASSSRRRMRLGSRAWAAWRV